jgi:glycosyltransferase
MILVTGATGLVGAHLVLHLLENGEENVRALYRNPKNIEKTILSTLKQNYKNINYIVIDGGSTDGTIEIINKYKEAIDLIISEPDEGIYDAMNKGIKFATGDVIGILNSDDLYFDESILSNIADCFIKNPNLDLIYGDLVYVKQNDVSKIVRYWKSGKYHRNYFEYGSVPAHPTLFIAKRIYDEIDLFNLDYKLASDYEFMLKLFKKRSYNFLYLNKIFVKMRLGGVTSKNLKNRIIQNKEISRAWKDNNLVLPIYFFPLRLFKKLLQYFQ